MHVAMLSSVNEPLEKITSGVPKATIELVRALRKYCSDVNIDIISLNPNVSKIVEYKSDAGSIFWLPTWKHGRSATLYFFDILKVLKFIKNRKYDLVHSHAFPEMIIAGELASRPHVVTIHGIVSKEANTYGNNPIILLREYLRTKLEKWYFKRIKVLISISSYVEKQLPLNAKRRIYKIDNAIGEKYFNLADDTKKGVILQVGTLTKRKGSEILIEAAKILLEKKIPFTLKLVGSTPDQTYLKLIKDQILKYRLKENIFILGTVSEEELTRFYEEAQIVCLCSSEETSPLSLAQGMAAGKIVIGSRSAGIPMIIDENKTGLLFEPDDYSSLANVLIDVLQNYRSYENMRASAIRDALDRFHPRIVAEKTKAVYNILKNG